MGLQSFLCHINIMELKFIFKVFYIVFFFFFVVNDAWVQRKMLRTDME
jgi:hypothetical protein